jgi:hypothetical protein
VEKEVQEMTLEMQGVSLMQWDKEEGDGEVEEEGDEEEGNGVVEEGDDGVEGEGEGEGGLDVEEAAQNMVDSGR